MTRNDRDKDEDETLGWIPSLASTERINFDGVDKSGATEEISLRSRNRSVRNFVGVYLTDTERERERRRSVKIILLIRWFDIAILG